MSDGVPASVPGVRVGRSDGIVLPPPDSHSFGRWHAGSAADHRERNSLRESVEDDREDGGALRGREMPLGCAKDDERLVAVCASAIPRRRWWFGGGIRFVHNMGQYRAGSAVASAENMGGGEGGRYGLSLYQP